METHKPFARAGYLLAAILVITPFFDGIMQLLPLQLGNERWRFGAVGSISNMMLVPLLGLLLAIGMAILADQRRVKRVLGAICGILALILAILTVLFILDYFQVRTGVVPRMQHATGVASSMAIGKDIFSIITLVLLSRVGFAGPKAVVVRKGATVPVRETSSTPLIPLGGAARGE